MKQGILIIELTNGKSLVYGNWEKDKYMKYVNEIDHHMFKFVYIENTFINVDNIVLIKWEEYK